MSLEEKDNLSKIEDLKGRLFSRNYTQKIEHYDTYRHRAPSVPESWEEEESKKEPNHPNMKTSVFKKIFIFSLVFFALSLIYVFFSFVGGTNKVSNNNIAISVLGNSFTNGGEDLPLIIEIVNKNNASLELVDLIVDSPRANNLGTDSTDRQRISLGNIPAGGVRNENVTIRLFGEQGTVHTVRIYIEYRVPGSNAIFIKEKVHEVSIESTPINLLIEAPSEIPQNQDLNIKIKASINSQVPSENVLIKIDYPLGFEFVQASPAPILSNNIFKLTNLKPGFESQISISGRMVDVWDGEEKVFKVWSGSQSSKEKSEIDIIFSSLAHLIRINKPFIEAKILVGGSQNREYASPSEAVVTGEVRWMNNLDTRVSDMQIRLKISGNAVDRTSIKAPRGFYNSTEDVIVWDKNSDPVFAEVDPGKFGTVSFSITPKQLYSSNTGILNQPSIELTASISGKQIVSGSVTKKVESNESKLVKIISSVGFSNRASYAGGPFVNTGPIPPKAEKVTTYTVTWNLSNTSNVIRNARVRATLPAWVSFTGVIFPDDANLTYNSSTREVIWDLGMIPRGAGLGTKGPEVAFQIAFTPSLSQVGDTPILIREAFLTGRDDFANVEITASKSALNTRISGDTTFDSKDARVVE